MIFFVYGTLDGNSLLQGEYISKATTKDKYYKGENSFYPYLVHKDNKKELKKLSNLIFQRVEGSLYKIPKYSIKLIDEYEGHPTLFKREIIEVKTHSGIVKAECYFLLDE